MTSPDPDPIKASYDVYIKPRISSDRQIFILQFPNRDASKPYTKAAGCAPLNLRTKPNSGMVELDIPLDVWNNYDKVSGVKYGDALKKSSTAKGGGSFGLPGGFGIGGAAPSARGRPRGDDDMDIDEEKILSDFRGAVQRGQVLTKQTLGGQSVSIEETTPQYMVGAFRKNQLHLTPIDHIVQMRPQFHHVDAQSEQERLGRLRESATPSTRTEARAIHMTVKSTIDGEESYTDNMAMRISATQAEPWRPHTYVDEDDENAWDSFNENLFVGRKEEESETLRERIPQLVSGLDDAEYMDAISAPRDEAKLSRSKASEKSKNQGAVGEDNDSSGTLSDTGSNTES